MPSRFIIEGAKPLSGEVEIHGSKNAVLPLIAACLLTDETCTLENVPEISDVETMAAMAKTLGAEVEWSKSERRINIQARTITRTALPAELARKLRASILFSGSLMGRMRQAEVPYPGGDLIGSRPLNTHLHALERLGVRVEDRDSILLDGRELAGANLMLEEPSVTATENTVLAAVLAPGRTVIRMAAFEPHVQELVSFLHSLGAHIRWSDGLNIEIEGVQGLSGGRHTVNPDELEISGFAALAAATRSEIALRNIQARYLDAVFLQLAKMGVTYELDGTDGTAMRILKPSGPYRAFRLQSGLYPKLGSDHLPPFAVLATQAEGTSLVHDWMYEGRLRYLPELQKMGANCTLLDPHRALIQGPTPLWGTELAGLDIRSGMTLVIAGLVARGQSVISDIQHLDRGYEKLDERLRALGAEIQRAND